MNVRVNGGGIRFDDFVPVVGRSGVGGLPARRRGRGRADLNSRKIGINENHDLAVGDFPGSSTHVREGNLRFLRRQGWRGRGLSGGGCNEREREPQNADATLKRHFHCSLSFRAPRSLFDVMGSIFRGVC